MLLAGFIAGRVTGSGSNRSVTVRDTIERIVVIKGKHVESASDLCGPGPLDLARVASVRRGAFVQTTIVACRGWRDSLLRRVRHGRVWLTIFYDTNNDGSPDRRDAVFFFRGRLRSWISSYGQGVQGADVTRRSGTTISVARDATVFFDAAGQGGLLMTAPIGVAVATHWPGGGDRVPDAGWITVPPPG